MPPRDLAPAGRFVDRPAWPNQCSLPHCAGAQAGGVKLCSSRFASSKA